MGLSLNQRSTKMCGAGLSFPCAFSCHYTIVAASTGFGFPLNQPRHPNKRNTHGHWDNYCSDFNWDLPLVNWPTRFLSLSNQFRFCAEESTCRTTHNPQPSCMESVLHSENPLTRIHARINSWANNNVGSGTHPVPWSPRKSSLSLAHASLLCSNNY